MRALVVRFDLGPVFVSPATRTASVRRQRRGRSRELRRPAAREPPRPGDYGVARVYRRTMASVDSEKIDAAVKGERDRIVVALRRLADRIEQAPVERVSEGLTWVATAAETLVSTIERALGGVKK
jgi:hypothetical protein